MTSESVNETPPNRTALPLFAQPLPTSTHRSPAAPRLVKPAGCLPRTWEIDDAAGSTAVRVTDFAGGEVTYLKASCDQVSDLTERMVALANSLGWIGPLTPLRRTRWA